jgi:hypothetical protein
VGLAIGMNTAAGTCLANAPGMPPIHVRFDHGTLLLQGLPADFDLGGLPDVAWDPRLRAHRAPARAYFALALELRRRGVPMTAGGGRTRGRQRSRFRLTAARAQRTPTRNGVSCRP